jgi:hypothetical protein
MQLAAGQQKHCLRVALPLLLSRIQAMETLLLRPRLVRVVQTALAASVATTLLAYDGQAAQAQDTRTYFAYTDNLAIGFTYPASDEQTYQRGKQTVTEVVAPDADIIVIDLTSGMIVGDGEGSLHLYTKGSIDQGIIRQMRVQGDGIITFTDSGEQFRVRVFNNGTSNGKGGGNQDGDVTVRLEPIG